MRVIHSVKEINFKESHVSRLRSVKVSRSECVCVLEIKQRWLDKDAFIPLFSIVIFGSESVERSVIFKSPFCRLIPIDFRPPGPFYYHWPKSDMKNYCLYYVPKEVDLTFDVISA